MTVPSPSTPDYTASGTRPPAQPPLDAPDAIRTETAQAAEPVLAQPVRRSNAGLVVAGVIGIAIAAAALLVVLVVLLSGLGGGLVVVGGVLALVPLAIVAIGVRWIDRWEPEPRSALIFAFLWGAGVSVLVTLLIGLQIEAALAESGLSAGALDFIGAAVQAPIVEETSKGIGVLLLFWFARRHFDGPVDGLVYAAWVAGGFAFTENILYFSNAIIESNGNPVDVAEIFVLRGLMSPFAHVMFTAFIGVLLGVAARVTNRFGAIFYFVLGLIPAILLHAFWNGALFFVWDFYGYYAIVQVPIFALMVLGVIGLRRQEAKLTHDRLAEYAAAGWFAPEEVAALATPRGRRVALAWARSRGAAAEMRRYERVATRLAFARQKIATGRDRIGAKVDERALLDEVVRARRALRARAPLTRA